ncbi:HEPN domain-containing protein [Methanobrevibacter ruminantium]|uniref:HEPN domain-containing protein n=1 Tax=Methanobrevibacter ruminantium TaxID=83816 RepID=UPI0026EFE1A5|nr:HEPN domain-containing protein [Methanobrevibacter ruminantium]
MHNLQNYPGTFWFKDNEENKFNGSIIEKNNHYFLKTDIKMEDYAKYYNKEIIIGSVNKTKVTLYKSRLWNPFETLTFSIGYIFKNYNYNSNLNFKEITLKFHNLEDWITNTKNYIIKINDNFEDLIKYESVNIKLKKFEMIFSLSNSISSTNISFCIKPNYLIQIIYENKTPIETILKDINIIKKFLTFSMHNETEIKLMTCMVDNEFNPFNKIEVYSKLFDRTIEQINSFDILIEFDEIKDKQLIFRNWFKISEKYKPLLDIYFVNFGNESYDEYQFLSYTQALESYLRKNEKYIGNYMGIEEYEVIENQIKDLIQKLIKNEAHKSSLENKIKFGYEVSLRKRLKDLINDLKDYEIINKIIDKNKDNFIREVVDTRNYYTHYDDSSNFKKDNEKLHILNFKLKILIELIILKELGFNKEFIDKKLIIKYGDILIS